MPTHLILVAAGTFVGATRSLLRGEVLDGLLIAQVGGAYIPGLWSLGQPNAAGLQKVWCGCCILALVCVNAKYF